MILAGGMRINLIRRCRLACGTGGMMTRAAKGNPEKAVPGPAAADGRVVGALPSSDIRVKSS